MSDNDPLTKSICPLPWIHLSFNTNTSLRACCTTNHGGFIKNDSNDYVFLNDFDSIKELFNQKTHRDLRVAMLNGERPRFCDSCYSTEDLGGVSIRNQYQRQYAHLMNEFVNHTEADGSIPEEHIKIRKVDLSLSNLCTLKCRMCDPLSSSSLKKEFDELKIDYPAHDFKRASEGWKFEKALFNIFDKDTKNLEQILTTGGEPFISKVHKEILTFLVERDSAKNITLTYHSSLTTLPKDLIDLWKNFKQVAIHLSLEGTEVMNDYARYPSKWDEILGNLKKLHELKDEINFSFEVHSCIQAISWLRHHELINFMAEINKTWKSIPVLPYPIWLENPSELSVSALPKELQLEGASRVHKAILKNFFISGNELNYAQNKDCYNVYNSIIHRIKTGPSDPELFNKFKKRVRDFDRLRNQNILEIVPEFKEYF